MLDSVRVAFLIDDPKLYSYCLYRYGLYSYRPYTQYTHGGVLVGFLISQPEQLAQRS